MKLEAPWIFVPFINEIINLIKHDPACERLLEKGN